MKLFIYRIAVVLAVCVALLALFSAVFSRDQRGKPRLDLSAVMVDGGEGGWTCEVTEAGITRFDNRQTSYDRLEQAIAELMSGDRAARLEARPGGEAAAWTAEIDADKIVIDGEASDLATLLKRLRDQALPEGFTPTRAVTVQDVLDVNPATPTRSRVSFPGLSFEQAFPGDSFNRIFPPNNGDDELFVIDHFSQAPILDHDKVSSGEIELPEQWAIFLPDLKTLPPVAERLPVNPAVTVGPDSPGRYSPLRTWRRAASGLTDWATKLGAESFIRFDPAGRIQPCLAYRWEVSDNNRVYTFYLRKGHRWSDGKPFTAHDIEFVCNTVIGSAYWGTSPNWMMETDGFSQFYSADILDWPAFKRAMLNADSPLAPLVARAADAELIETLKALPDDRVPESVQAEAVVSRLNAMFRNASFFDAEVLGAADLESDLAKMRDEIGYSRLDTFGQWRLFCLMERNDLLKRAREDLSLLQEKEISRLNLMLLRANLRGIVAPAERRRVKVEAVADADGDDSHIIRFTFPRPNSIFLEKTGTFMFYRGLFAMQEEYYRKYIPDASDLIAVQDIYDWPGFVARLVEQGRDEAPSPARQLWQRLDEATRQTLLTAPPTEDSPEADRQAVVDAINAALVSPDFYDPAIWSGVDLDKRWNELTAAGISLANSRVPRNQVLEIMDRRDLVKRWQADRASLSEAEQHRMNMYLLRDAFGPSAGLPELIAVNRETALDRAAQRMPTKYTTWVSRAQKLQLEVTCYADHVPTLRAWTPISEKIDPEYKVLRNPYYYRVDQEGRQLPYIDCIESKVQEEPNVLLSMSSGNVDMQCRVITFANFSFLKAHEKQGDYRTLLWANDYVGEINFLLNQVHKDPELRRLFNEKTFRHALSLALDRQAIIDIVYQGVGEPGTYSVPKGSPYYNENQATAYIQHDPAEANRLLDALGLDKRGPDGMRLLPGGEPLNLNLDVTETPPAAAMMLACEQWRSVGLNVTLKIRAASLINRMIDIGILDISTSKEGGNYVGPMQVGPIAPVHPAECPHWNQWVRYINNRGRSGEAPPEWLLAVNRMWTEVIEAENDAQKFAAWNRLCEWAAEDLPRIGITTSPGKVIYVKNDFKNVPDLALAGWIAHEPSNVCPSCFYFSEEPAGDGAAK